MKGHTLLDLVNNSRSVLLAVVIDYNASAQLGEQKRVGTSNSSTSSSDDDDFACVVDLGALLVWWEFVGFFCDALYSILAVLQVKR